VDDFTGARLVPVGGLARAGQGDVFADDLWVIPTTCRSAPTG
jgi:hypothetical protein